MMQQHDKRAARQPDAAGDLLMRGLLMRFPLRFTLPIGLLALGLLAAVVVAFASTRMSDAQAERFVSELMVTIGNQAGADVASGLRHDDPGRIRGALEQLQVLRGLRSAVLLTGNDEVIYSSDIGLVGSSVAELHAPGVLEILAEARRSGSSAQLIDGGHLYFASFISGALPLYLASGDDAHVLLLEYNYSALQAAHRSAAINQALIVAATILLLSISCWLFLKQVLLARILALGEASQRIGLGDLETPIDVAGGDEVGQLGRALDSMRLELGDTQNRLELRSQQLEVANAAIEQERATLAARVLERTEDLTLSNAELGRAKEAAEAASVAKSAFLATVSHEIRTPMNGVLGAMELLERTGLDGRRAWLLKTARESARSLLALLSDLLDMAKIEAGRIEISAAPASLASVVDRVVATHMPTAIARGNALTSSVAPEVPPWVAIDALRVQQILGNFVSNAIKFTNGGNIQLDVNSTPLEQDRHRLQFRVSDDGDGIAADVVERLFQPFVQGSGEHSRITGSTGLGLAICKGLADRMGASVSLLSKKGQGTTARLELDVSSAAAPRTSEQRNVALDDTAIIEVTRMNANDSPCKVLVVDDHPVNRSLQARQMEQLGMVAETAHDGVDALQKLRSSEFDLLITDCEMPQMDGYQLAKEIRQSDGALHTLPIIACTAHALPEVAKKCLDVGMDAVLTKPMQLRELARELRRVLPAARQQPMLEDIFDEQQLDKLTGQNEELRKSLFESFVEDYRRSSIQLALAVERMDLGLCREIAHRNKGACAVFGAVDLGKAFAAMESCARESNPSAATLQAAIEHIEAAGNRLAEGFASLA